MYVWLHLSTLAFQSQVPACLTYFPSLASTFTNNHGRLNVNKGRLANEVVMNVACDLIETIFFFWVLQVCMNVVLHLAFMRR